MLTSPRIGGEDLIERWMIDNLMGVHRALDGFGDFWEGDFFRAECFNSDFVRGV